MHRLPRFGADAQFPRFGVIVIGKIDSGVEAFNVSGSVKVTIEPYAQKAN